MPKIDFVSRARQCDASVECVQQGWRDPQSLALNTKRIEPYAAFFALKGIAHDGRDFIAEAVERGACWIVTDQRDSGTDWPQVIGDKVGLLTSAEPRALLAKLAADWYGASPSQQILITGTNGKSSVAEYIVQLGRILKVPTASIGTLGVRGMDEEHFAPALTSPDSVSLHQLLAVMEKKGVDVVAIEASSHGLEQYRLEGTRPTIGVFTGLGRDHLDYHPSVEAYLQAKLGLFARLLPKTGLALCAAGREGAMRVTQTCAQRGIRVLSYGDKNADFALSAIKYHAGGTDFTVQYQQHTQTGCLPLWGKFQLDNALAAAACWIGMGIKAEQVLTAMTQMQAVPGRLELVATSPQGATIFVDYAHTPDAMETLLHDIRPHTLGKLWVVFGCGGNRDQGKRAEMGAIAQRLADRVIITDDNPRFEEPAVIRAMIMKACPEATEVADRREAIMLAMTQAKSGDCVIIAGKGHETGQTVGARVYPFDDRKVVGQIVGDYLGSGQ